MKYTDKDFERFLEAFKKNDEILIHAAIRLVACDGLHSELFENVNRGLKASLIRKCLRYIATTALKGTFEIDGLSQTCCFCEIKNGNTVSFGKDDEWTFWSNRLRKQVTVKIDFKHRHIIYVYQLPNEVLKIYGFDAWDGLHLNTDAGRVDIVLHFEDPRTDIK